MQENIKPQKRERKPPKKITAGYLHNAGLYYLQRFSASAGHFRSVMMRKINRSCQFHPEQDRNSCVAMLDDLIVRFTASGLLNDESYSRGMVASLRRRGMSSRMITMRLQSKGLDAEKIAAALADYGTDAGPDAELVAAIKLARRKKIGPFSRPGIDTPFEKSLAALARAGFDFETARRVLEMSPSEAEDVLAGVL